ncbi:MAG: integration host factor subunit beta [Alphaproteobacteria bacterium]|nr:integration host factor subunit beta [Alphaproteobacteria bacterium]
MTRSELIEKIAKKNPNLLLGEIEHIVSVIFSSITSALAKGDRVEFRGFGVFSIHKRAPRIAQNPRTGTKVQIGNRNIVHFKVGKELHESLNEK